MSLSANDQSLINNAKNGNLEKVRDLLRAGAHVNAKDSGGRTALYWACNKSLSDVALEILERDNVDVHVKDSGGRTALYWACCQSLSDVALEILKRDNVDVNVKDDKQGWTALYWACCQSLSDVALEIMKRDDVEVNAEDHAGRSALYWACFQSLSDVALEILKRDEANVNVKDDKGQTAYDLASQNNLGKVVRALLQRSYAAVIEEDRAKLFELMTRKSKNDDPVELSLEYIKHCTPVRELGSGSFGKVTLVEDYRLPKKFAVKNIKFSPSSDGSSAEALHSFQRELSTLKRFHHPNIIALYGYNLSVSHEVQFLVFEYAANGSLDGFLKNDDARASLPAATRLSIMYQVAKAVHFLHTGGAGGLKVFHRDIKSANICLTEDFTPRLIDCGLAKLVEDVHSDFPLETTKQTGSTQGPAKGTYWYRCPEYTSKKAHHIKCDYIPAYDVYSFGIVMAELILGRLNDGEPTNVLQTYVLNGQTPIADGWEQLRNDADNKITWNADALKLVCKTVIGCITPSSEGRLSTDKLLDLLKHAKNIHDGTSDVEPKDAIAKLDAILFNVALGFCRKCVPTAGGSPRPAVIKCSKGHGLCKTCLEDAMQDVNANRGDRQLPCLIDGCASQPFQERDLCRCVNDSTYQHFFVQPLHTMVASKVDDVNRSVNEVKELQQNTKQVANEINDRVKKLASVIDRHLPAWALQAAYADRLKQCPTVVVITRIAVDRSKNLEKWFTKLGKQKYQLVFYCERSGQPGHDPFEISVDRKWMVKVAPWLRIAINIGAAWDPSKVSPAVLKEFPLPVHSKEMEALIKALGKEENIGQLQTLQRDALEAIGQMANKTENLKKWRDEMEPVVGENGRTMWVKRGRLGVVGGSFQNSEVDVNVQLDDDTTALDVARSKGHGNILYLKEYAQVEKDGASLGSVMTTRRADPVELSYQYIKRCITNSKLGSGAFGDVFLAEDSRLPKKFVVKMITLSERSDGGGPNEDNLKNFQEELSTLKRLHHPNILDLYGYNFKGGAGEQFLVYEYTANGSLDRFLKDESKRADLPAATRLSIMQQVASAVDFLHNGGAGLKVLHRDIKSANIYLTEDFTPKLIDCGLATFVEDERNAFPSATIMQTGSTGGPASGTIGYVCPEYALNRARQIECDYIPAYDVYSVGIVMAELILGRLNDGDPTNVFETYVLNGETPIVDGWQQLINDADGLAEWNAVALEFVCKTVIGCITPSSKGRVNTDVLLPALAVSIVLNVVQTYALRVGFAKIISMLNEILHNNGKRSAESDGLPCNKCGEKPWVVECSYGHHRLCVECINDAVVEAAASFIVDFRLPCLIHECRSESFTFDDIQKHVSSRTLIILLITFKSKASGIINQDLNEIKKDVGEILVGLSWLSAKAEQSNSCPSKVKVTPIPNNANFLMQKYKVYFHCDEDSERQGHDNFFVISVYQEWLVEVADHLPNALKAAGPFDHTKVSTVLSGLPLFKHITEMKPLIKALRNNGNHDEILTLTGGALRVMADMAKEHESLWKWKAHEPPTVGSWRMVKESKNGRTIWATRKFESTASASSSTTAVDVPSHE